MPSTESPLPPCTAYAATTVSHQAGARAVNADRAALTGQYEELRLQLVDLRSAVQPDIKTTYGLIGNNPIED